MSPANTLNTGQAMGDVAEVQLTRTVANFLGGQYLKKAL